jgi:hypothetical protein
MDRFRGEMDKLFNRFFDLRPLELDRSEGKLADEVMSKINHHRQGRWWFIPSVMK